MQMPEFENRVKVLEDLGYVDDTGTVKLKGRVACEINSGDEMVATEMIFTGFLTELDPEEAVALVSAFVFQVIHFFCFSEVFNANKLPRSPCI